MIHVVECGFADRSREAEWNVWYSGPKLDKLLTVPDFLSAQRFKALDDRPAPYLNVTAVTSARIFTSPDYRDGGGGRFGPWDLDLLVDWTRRLFSGLDDIPAVPMEIRLAMLDLAPENAPDLGLQFNWLVSLDWHQETGYEDGIALDGSVPHRGIAVTDPATAADLPAIPELRVFQPLCPKRTKGSAR